MSKRSKRYLVATTCVGLAAFAAWYVWRDDGQKTESKKANPLVSVAIARTQDLPVRFYSQGHLTPLNEVEIRPQVAGRIRSIHFRQGDDVKAGQLLFTLDDSESTAQLNRIRAQATQIKAQLEEAERALRRANELVGTGYISASSVDTLMSNVKTLEAQRRAAIADIEGAQVQLGYTRIHAPISAKAGAVEVHPGALAQPGDALPLVSLLQFDPIGVDFELPEQHLATLLAARQTGDTRVSLAVDGAEAIAGELIFVNNTVNTNTGTIRLKATFSNADHALWPGAFVRVTLDAGVDRDAIVLPPQAVLEGPKGHFVFNVDADGKVTSHPVKVLRIQDQNAVVTGVANGERVVVEGNQDLRAGSTATVAPESPAAESPAPAQASLKADTQP